MSVMRYGSLYLKVLAQRGSALVEGLLAVVVFSVGLISLLMLLAATQVDSANAHYRSVASLLASDLVARMWNGDRSAAALQARFADGQAPEYLEWQQRVQAALPGVTLTELPPQVVIDPDRNVTIELRWRSPAESSTHRLVVHTQLSD